MNNFRFILLLFILTSSTFALENVKLQLKWMHSYQFAGYYMAIEKGYYKDAGLDVTIIERDPQKNNIAQVLEGEAEYGVSDSTILLYRAQGHPVKLLATIYQHSPLVLIAHKDLNILSPFDMKGKKVSYQQGIDDSSIIGMLNESHVTSKDYTFVPLDFTSQDFIDRKVDVMSAYISDQPFKMKTLGIDINIINPRNYGIDFYGDNLFTTEKEIANNPQRVKAFYEASLKGWKYALKNQKETIEFIIKKYKLKQSFEHQLYEATTSEKLIAPDIVEIGYTNTNRLYRIADIYAQTQNMNLELMYKAVETLKYDIYKTNKSAIPTYILYILLGLFSIIIFTIIISFIFRRRMQIKLKHLTTEMFQQRSMIDRYIMMSITNTEGIITYINDAYSRNTGYKSHELVGKNFKKLRHPDTPSQTYKELWETVTNKGTWEGEVVNKNHDGSLMYATLFVEPILKDGHIEGYRSIKQDVTYQKQLIQTQNQLLEAQQISHMGSWSYDVKKDTLSWSSEIFKIFEINQKAILPSYDLFLSMIHPDDKEAVNASFQKSLDEHSAYAITHRIITSKGKLRYVSEKGKTIYDEKGNPLITNGTVIDVTTEELLKEELLAAKNVAEAASNYKSEFLANMSHEIRTPLNGIIGLTNLVLKTDLNEKQRDYLDKVKSSSHTLLHVINDILDYSKVEAGKLELENKAFHLDDVLQSIKDIFELACEQKGLSFELQNEVKNTYLLGDSLRLTQIFTNLVGNAIKFTQEGKILIRARELEQKDNFLTIEFSVQDSGIGMKPEVIQNLFRAFAQADTSTTREYGGSGLGLTISKQLVTLMSGTIWVNSEEGLGSEFNFTAVFEKAHKIQSAQTTSEDTTFNFKGNTILVAEDNKTNQMVIHGMLEDYGLIIHMANNGQEAVEKVKQHSYDLILMDIQMPVMDGFEATKLIKEIQPNLPIVALTANAMKSDKEKTLAAGMLAHISKPIDQAVLKQVISRFLEAK